MSGDRFVEVTRQGYFSRLANSIVGVAMGFVLVIGSIVLLVWNEGHAVREQRRLDDATRLVVDIDAERVDPANNGKLVHVSGEAVSHTPVRDGDLGVVFNDVVVVARSVEMYQWIEDKSERTIDEVGGTRRTETTYDYRLGWTDEWRNSESFRQPTGHGNPPMPMQSVKWAATGTTIGAFKLEREALLLLTPDSAFAPETLPEGWKASGGSLYRGEDSGAPKLGDVRVTYKVLRTPAPISIMARQMGSGFETYEMPRGAPMFLAGTGIKSAGEMIRAERQRENMIAWALRLAGLGAMWLGFSLIMGPLQALANVLPFLANVAGFAIGVVALALTLPIGGGIIGVAWLIYRPLIGVPILIAAAVAAYFLIKQRHRIGPPPAAAPSS